ncbi:hypothetical protein [Parapedobacter defluvii]|uniref:hypothetical protein n=1 Tax=Parapedobacter defluvii TaxID=2045106 RepID=UPI00166DA47F|nr:hypothetical protein [Parapedobacter defluvii]
MSARRAFWLWRARLFVARRDRALLSSAESNQRLAAVSCRYHGSASHCKPRQDKAALAGYDEEVLTGAGNGRSERNGCSYCNTSPFGGGSALKNREAGSRKACAGTCVLATYKRIGEAQRLQYAP